MSVVLWGCLLGGISKLLLQVETSLWHLHILSPLPSTSESFVACSKKEKMLHKLHSPRQFQASRHATVDCFPCPFFLLSPSLLAGSLSVGKNEAAAKATEKEASRSWVPAARQLQLGAVSVSGSGIFCLWLCVLGRKWSGGKQRQLLPVHARIFKIQHTQWSGEARERTVCFSLSLSLCWQMESARGTFLHLDISFEHSFPFELRHALVYFQLKFLATDWGRSLLLFLLLIVSWKTFKKPQLNLLELRKFIDLASLLSLSSSFLSLFVSLLRLA